MKEYGGYLPLELNKGSEYYKKYDPNVMYLSSGRAAIITAVKQSKCNKILLPLYLCESVKNALEEEKIKIEYYNIDTAFMPIINRTLQKDEILLWTNYFGTQTRKKVEIIVKKYVNVIIDNTQAFFFEPFATCYNIYSCRKFIGVSDGAYLIARGMKEIMLKKDISYSNALYLFKSLECGTNEAYQDSVENEGEMEKEPLKEMSLLTHSILKSVNYDSIKEIRTNNFNILKKSLDSRNELEIEDITEIPMVYPFLIKSETLRKALIDKKIYISQWWKWVLFSPLSNEFEQKLSNYLLPLPIDQRYSTEDMKYIIKVILDHI